LETGESKTADPAGYHQSNINQNVEAIPSNVVGDIGSAAVCNNHPMDIKTNFLERGNADCKEKSCWISRLGMSCKWKRKCRKQVPSGPPKVLLGGLGTGIHLKTLLHWFAHNYTTEFYSIILSSKSYFIHIIFRKNYARNTCVI
jgi:hypothetical protein